MDLELMLEKAKTVVRQREAIHEQQVTLKGDRLQATQLLEAVGQKNQKVQKNRQAHLHRSDVRTPCGKDQHPRNACPEKEATCRNARKKAIILL